MKSSDFAQILVRIADLTDPSPVRDGVSRLAITFAQSGNATVAGTLKRAAAGTTQSGEGLSTAPVLPLLRQVTNLLAVAGKPAVVKDLNELVRVLERHPHLFFTNSKASARRAAIPKVRSEAPVALKTDLVEAYDRDLAAALRNEADFGAVFLRLENDPQMGPSELRELAKSFSGALGKSRSDSLKRIMSRHQSVMTIRAKDRATAGRSAA